MASAPSCKAEKKRWWLSNRKMVGKHISDARTLIATQQPSDVSAAITHLDAALSVDPQNETALELKARSLLFLRKFRDVADLLKDYIPSFKYVAEEDISSTSLSSGTSRERVNLLPSVTVETDRDYRLWCFSLSDLRRKVLAGICKNRDRERHWRYIVLGQACCHLGMMEDAMVLLQTGRRLAAAASRRESHDLHDDNFSEHQSMVAIPPQSTSGSSSLPTPQPTELESAVHLLNHIKLLLRRRAAAAAALDANLPSESIRHFSKILESRRGVPSPFATLCLIGRAAAYKSSGRIAEGVADCNRALALDPASIPAMRARADLLESIRSYPDCLRDLDHLKLLYDAILRDRKLPGPPWRPHHGIRYRDIPRELRALTERIQELRQRAAKGEGWSVDYYGVVGVKRGCTRSELERNHLLLSLKHRPDRAGAFLERLELVDEHRDLDTVKDEARMSALILYRLLQKGYSNIMSDVMDQEVAERQRFKENAAAAVTTVVAMSQVVSSSVVPLKPMLEKEKENEKENEKEKGKEKEKEEKDVVEIKDPAIMPRLAEKKPVATAAATMFQGVFCRDLAAVGSLLSQVGFNQSIPVKLEALSC